ncbi:hypothetical protein FBEOM_4480 [Fusarium beomiforme]|uniref:Uncharacterized protein n=1 Tax=Fusarium beomiforme TaxID=44412 RepID=A0A9P5E0X7_9HYPO|nr:hypothetical protein FBEOM_4480 [Fusarium beomiforme]
MCCDWCFGEKEPKIPRFPTPSKERMSNVSRRYGWDKYPQDKQDRMTTAFLQEIHKAKHDGRWGGSKPWTALYDSRLFWAGYHFGWRRFRVALG